VHRLDAEDGRPFLLAWGADKGQRGPVPFEGVLVETLDAAQRNRAGAPRVRLDVFEVEEIVPEFFLPDLVWGCVVVLGQLPYRADIALLGPCRKAAELEVCEHALA
jgi:hypothetical protein